MSEEELITPLTRNSKSSTGFNNGITAIETLWSIHNRIENIRGRISMYNKSQSQIDLVETSSETDSVDETIPNVQTYIVIKFAPNINLGTLSWLINKIKGKRRNGGAELLLRKQIPNKNEGLILHVSASKIKFLELAEEMEIVKCDRNGVMREFTVNELEDFLEPGMHVDDFLTTAERQTIIRHELENIRALAEDSHIPGYPMQSLYEGQSITEVCLQARLIQCIFPLHDTEELKKLAGSWYRPLIIKCQPIEDIRSYFGESVALYFVFLGYYTMSLMLPMTLGIIQSFLSSETVPFFCVFNVIWVTVFAEIWKRKCSELAYKWGTIRMTSLDEPRPSYYGHMKTDPVTQRRQPQYERWKTYAKMYCVSLPIVFACMCVGFAIMLVSFWCEDQVRIHISFDNPYRTYFIICPSIIYAAVVYIMNFYYRKLATQLTEWENHRTQSQFDRHRVTKLVLFEFVNNFMSLFYIAFIIQDMEMLQSQLVTMLIILQIINNFQEAILPLIVRFYRIKLNNLKKFIETHPFRKSSKKNVSESTKNDRGDFKTSTDFECIPTIPAEDPQCISAQEEGNMETYEGTYDDYLEMFIQFGYVILFSSVYPLAAFWAVLNNIFEIRADAFKLCRVYQRPTSRRVKDIGAWQRAFEIMGALSIMTNCGLLALSPKLRKLAVSTTNSNWILNFVILEHILLGLRYIIHISIPDKPEAVRIALARSNYESKQALKKERSQKSKRNLIRRFSTVQGKSSFH